MGFYLRKAKKIGPIRLNLSKSGIGISGGVTGARLGVNSQGRTYVHMGRHGLYYRKNIGQDSTGKAKEQGHIESNVTGSSKVETYHSKEIDNLTDAESRDFVDELQKKSKKIEFWKWLGLYPSILLILFALIYLRSNNNESPVVDNNQSFTIINEVVNVRNQPTTESDIISKARSGEEYSVINEQNSWVHIRLDSINSGFIYSSMGKIEQDSVQQQTTAKGFETIDYVYLLVLAILLLIWTYFMFKFDLRRKSIELYYAFDDEFAEINKNFIVAFKGFTKTNKIWEVLTSEKNKDTKYTGGAKTSVNRIPIKQIKMNQSPTPYLETNVEIPYIKLKHIDLFFLPERLLLRRNKKFAAVSYSNIKIERSDSRFIENESVPKDAEIVDYTWQYVNKSGSPDKRFKNNRKLPICKYSEYHFKSDQGINELLMTSKVDSMDEIVKVINQIGNSEKAVI